MPLDLSPLSRAIARFEEGLSTLRDRPDDTLVRDGVIQRFEFTYEISHRMLRRYLELTAANPAGFDAIPFQDLIRTGNEQGLLLSDWTRWREFRQARTDTRHTYNEEKALRVIAVLPDFLEEARFLLRQLQARHA